MIKQILISIFISIFLIFAYLKYFEYKGIFYPAKEVDFTPEYIGLKYNDIYLDTDDGLRLNGWFIPEDNARGTILFCHGNAGNIGHRLEKIALLQKARVNIFIIDYRGYGRSQGKPSEKGIYLDAKAAYDYLINKRRIRAEDIILYGESLGCAAVIHLASEQKVGALIVEGAFSKGRDMARRIYPFLPAFFFSNIFDCLTKISKVDEPKLFIHSKNDEIVPISLARKLYNAAPQPKSFVELIGGHNTAFLDSKGKYISSIIQFLDANQR